MRARAFATLLLLLAPPAASGKYAFSKTVYLRLAGPAGAGATGIARIETCSSSCGTAPFQIASVLFGSPPVAKYFPSNSSLLTSFPPFDLPASASCFAAGFLVDIAAARSDIAFCDSSGTPVTARVYSLDASNVKTDHAPILLPGGESATGILAAREMLRASGTTSWALMVAGTSRLEAANVHSLDLGSLDSYTWAFPGAGATRRLQGLWLSPTASENGDQDDVAWSRQGVSALELLWLNAPLGGTLAAGTFFLPVEVPLPAPANGAGALDADGDGTPDLWVSVGASPARLLVFHNSGDPAQLPSATAVDMGARLGISNPAYLHQIQVGSEPALAIADPDRAEVVVVTSDATAGPLTWRVPSSGAVQEIWAGNWKGDGNDLVVAYTSGDIDVYLNDALPSIGWSPDPTGTTVDSPASFGIWAQDSDGTIAKAELFVAGVQEPVATTVGPPGQTTNGRVDLTLTGDLGAVCGQSIQVFARATDDAGGFAETGPTTVNIADVAPSATLAGAPGPIPIALLPGGTPIEIEAAGTDPCGRDVAFAWTDQGLPAGAWAGPDEASGTRGVHRLFLPESSYPGILALAAPAMEVAVTPMSPQGLAGAPASVSLVFDASGLVSVRQVSDRPELQPGELALLTISAASSLSVDLPRVRIQESLDGLDPAGAASVLGAPVVAGTGLEWTLERLPAGGEVQVRLPVRRSFGPAAAARALVFAEGGSPLSRSGQAGVSRPALPGVKCGQGAGGWPAVLLLAFWAARRRNWRGGPKERQGERS